MLDAIDRRLIERLCGDIGDDLAPFHALAGELGIPVEELLARARGYREQGLLRRFGAVLYHRNAGLTANGLSAWNVPDAQVEAAGARMALEEQVSHCYARPRLPDWPYNVYAMIHGESQDDCARVAARIAAAIGITDYAMLFSEREFKKTSMVYQLPAPSADGAAGVLR